MAFFNLYRKTVNGARLGSPALSSDVSNGFFTWSLDPRTHSTKDETTHNDAVCCLIVDDSIWEVYEGATGTPILCHRATSNAYNALTDVIITKRDDIFSIELVGNGTIAPNKATLGLSIADRKLSATNIGEFNG